MAVLNIRNLPDDVHARLRVRAAKAGRSMEAEVRAILVAALNNEQTTKSVRSKTPSEAVKRYDEFMSRTKGFQYTPMTREEMNERK